MSEERKEKFTPGPWRAELTRVYPPNGDMICLPWDNKTTFDEAKANAALVSAAPEMYDWQADALAEMRRICPMLGVPYDVRERLEQLIERGEEIQKKARGEEC